MTELERRALLGDKQAKYECTKKGVVLACPKCYGNVSITEVTETESDSSMYFMCVCCGLGMRLTQMYAYGNHVRVPLNHSPLAQWNTRHAPPIGRRGECSHFGHNEENETYCSSVYGLSEPREDDSCSYFAPKEDT